MKETLKHKEAFEYYYSLGSARAFRLVAGECRVSEKSVAAWSKAFDWQARIEQRDIDNGKKLQKATDETVVAVKAKYRKIVQAAIGDFVDRIKAGRIAVDNVSDLERLIKLDLLLMGEATEKTEQQHHIEEVCGLDRLSQDELRQRVEDAARRLAAGSLP